MGLSKNYRKKYSYINNKRIKKIRRSINLLGYGSLFLDICIEFISVLSLLNITTGKYILVPIHYMLTSVIILSLISIGMFLYLKHYERLMVEFLRMKYKIKLPIPSPRTRYSLKWTIKWTMRRKWKNLKKFLGL